MYSYLPVGEELDSPEIFGELLEPVIGWWTWVELFGLRDVDWDKLVLAGLVAWPEVELELVLGPFSSSYSSSLNHISSSSSSWRGSLLKRPGRRIELTLKCNC